MAAIGGKRVKIYNQSVVDFLKESVLKSDSGYSSREELSQLVEQMNRLARVNPETGLSDEKYEIRGREKAAGVRIRCKQARCRFDIRFKLFKSDKRFRVSHPLTVSHCAIFHSDQ